MDDADRKFLDFFLPDPHAKESMWRPIKPGGTFSFLGEPAIEFELTSTMQSGGHYQIHIIRKRDGARHTFGYEGRGARNNALLDLFKLADLFDCDTFVDRTGTYPVRYKVP